MKTYRNEILEIRQRIDKILADNGEDNRMPYDKYVTRLDSGSVAADLENYRTNIRMLARYSNQYGVEFEPIAGFGAEWK